MCGSHSVFYFQIKRNGRKPAFVKYVLIMKLLYYEPCNTIDCVYDDDDDDDSDNDGNFLLKASADWNFC